MARIKSFVMFAEMRTGSNFLEANLNALPGVICHGELFNPHFIGKKDQMSLFGTDLAAREADPLRFWRRVRDETAGLAGFRHFHDHDPRIVDAVMGDASCAKIVLTRNPLDSYVSLKIAEATGQWRLTNVKNLKSAKVRFVAAEFAAHLAALQAFQVALLHRLQVSGQTAFYIDYDDIQDLEVLNGLAAFLGVEGRLDAADGKLKKQNPEPIEDKVENLAEMQAALARLDRFNLSRTPNFEPRRPAAVPSFVAAAGLVYMPIRSGPEEQVTGWLSSLGALTRDFDQKSLRQWKRAHPGHRSFTVIRHPVARAHAGFCRLLATPAPELRAALMRVQGVRVPPAGQVYADAAAFAEGFAGFLRFLKPHVAGQTGLRIDAHHASQTAALQGFAQFQGPDAVLREERLAEGLAWLAAECGGRAPALPPGPELPVALNGIYDAAIESAAREAYGRDYQAFGFSDWVAPPVQAA